MRKISKKETGITLIALIITIVVMLILVVVSVQIALDTGLFESTGKATKDWELAQDEEAELGNGKVNIGGTVYNSIEEYTSSISGGNAEVDFEKLFETAQKHPDQSAENNDIGIAEDGSIVNLDLWFYELIVDSNEYTLGKQNSSIPLPGYRNENIINGEIIGKVPMYIKQEGTETYYPVTAMIVTFVECVNLMKAPEIPSTVTNMSDTFSGCTELTAAPEIPDSVTNMSGTFSRCESLTEVPVIPNSVENMSYTFAECTLLTKVPAIPNSVTDMSGTFSRCESLTEVPAISNSVTDMIWTFQNCTSLVKVPEISDSVTNMWYTFSGCTSLTEAPAIPSSVTSMHCTFEGCTSLTEAPAIPSSVTDMNSTFKGCTSLTKAPVVPSSVENIISTFEQCTSLTGTLTINTYTTERKWCLSGAATNEGCNLVLNGNISAASLSRIYETKSSNSKIDLDMSLCQ